MIITLKGATGTLSFADNKIGVLDSYNITRVIDSGVTYTGPTSIKKGSTSVFTATLTLKSNYAYTEGVTVKMGGTDVDPSCIVTSGSTTTITISSVTGNITIKALTYDTTTGESGGSGGDDTSFDFTTATWLYNRYIKETTGGIASGATSGQSGHGTYTACEAFIPVVGGTTYRLTLNGVAQKSRFWSWYTDANVDSFISGDATTVEDRTAPENAKYVRISLMAPYFYTAAEQVIDENGKLTNPDPSTIKLVPVL